MCLFRFADPLSGRGVNALELRCWKWTQSLVSRCSRKRSGASDAEQAPPGGVRPPGPCKAPGLCPSAPLGASPCANLLVCARAGPAARPPARQRGRASAGAERISGGAEDEAQPTFRGSGAQRKVEAAQVGADHRKVLRLRQLVPQSMKASRLSTTGLPTRPAPCRPSFLARISSHSCRCGAASSASCTRRILVLPSGRRPRSKLLVEPPQPAAFTLRLPCRNGRWLCRLRPRPGGRR